MQQPLDPRLEAIFGQMLRPSGITVTPPRDTTAEHRATGMVIDCDAHTGRITRVEMDTAPTGHTLLLLDATGAYDREIQRQMGGKGLHFTTPMMQLQDPKQTKVLLVTLAETTPVLEAANLQADLRRAGIEPWAWVVNNSVAAAQPSSPLLRERAHNERAEIDAVAQVHSQRYAVVPLLQQEPVGVERLLALSGPLPAMA